MKHVHHKDTPNHIRFLLDCGFHETYLIKHDTFLFFKLQKEAEKNVIHAL